MIRRCICKHLAGQHNGGNGSKILKRDCSMIGCGCVQYQAEVVLAPAKTCEKCGQRVDYVGNRRGCVCPKSENVTERHD